MPVIPKVLCRFDVIPIFSVIEKMIQKFICRHQRPPIAKVILNNKNKAAVITVLDFKTCNRAVSDTGREIEINGIE